MIEDQKLITEFVWIPTYIGVFLLLAGVFNIGVISIFAALIACRKFLEILYRIIFGAPR